MISEKLLQFIWQFQYFNKNELHTEDGEPLVIVKQGLLNNNQGPDFLQAVIQIGPITFAGNIELHIRSSDWHKHLHGNDKNYLNIILHVVWENDTPVKDVHNETMPTLVLQDRIPKLLLEKYEQLMNGKQLIPCSHQLPLLNETAWLAWKERLAIERLEQKAIRVLGLYELSNHHWEEVFWWLLASNFGIKINASFFEEIAKTISIKILAKHKNQIHQLEALLLGQANLLNETFNDDYPILLQKEYIFLQQKYSLKKLTNQPAFLRMRPAAFPTIRLALLAMLVYNSSHLFSKVKEMETLDSVKQLFDITANDYWHYHYTFKESAVYQPKKLGSAMIENIIINTIIPVLFAYGIQTKEQLYKDKALRWLQELPAEQNSITRQWKLLNVTNSNALDAQALIQLTNHYCKEKKCLSCAVGNKLMKSIKV